jgi:threonine dehydrogenase-like Zn-dependent dehydrogenase
MLPIVAAPRPVQQWAGPAGAAADPLPMLTMFDKQIQLRRGRADVKRRVDDIMPLLDGKDVLDVESFATHRIPLDEPPDAYKTFQKKQDGAVNYVMAP